MPFKKEIKKAATTELPSDEVVLDYRTLSRTRTAYDIFYEAFDGAPIKETGRPGLNLDAIHDILRGGCGRIETAEPITIRIIGQNIATQQVPNWAGWLRVFQHSDHGNVTTIFGEKEVDT